MEELMKRHEAIGHLVHRGEKDPNMVLYRAFLASGQEAKAARFLDYRKRWEESRANNTVSDIPLFVTFAFNNTCNLSCTHCYRAYNSYASPVDSMPFETTQALLRECKELGVPSIGLGSESEYFMGRDADRIIALATELDFEDVWLFTNGQLLDDRRARMVVDSGITRMSISVDAISRQTYKKVRNSEGFYKLMRNIYTFLELREKTKARLPVLRLTFVDYNLNTEERDTFVDFWRKTVDEVDVQPLIDVKNIDRLEYTEDTGHTCLYPNNTLYVDWAGEFKPCCTLFSRNLSIGRYPDMSVRQVWGSEALADLRRQLAREKPLNRTCINCLQSLRSGAKYSSLSEGGEDALDGRA